MTVVMEDRQLEKLAIKAANGNAKAYGQLIEYYKEYLYRTAWLMVKNQDKALDIVGECILRGFRSIQTLQKPEYFKSWLTRVLINVAKSDYRKNPDMESLNDKEDWMNGASEYEEGISCEERMDLHHAIDLLPEKQRTVIILKYFDEMKIDEIAYVMRIPAGSVKAYLNRARTELRTILKEDYLYER